MARTANCAIEELIQLAKDMRKASERGEQLGLTEDEVAFYDALESAGVQLSCVGAPASMPTINQGRAQIQVAPNASQPRRSAMKTFTKQLAAATAAAIAFAAPSANATQGDVVVYNNSSASIAPYFKFHCPDTDWIWFGGIGPNSQFAWNGLTPDGCVIEFTYTLSGGPAPQDPVKGNHRTRFTFEADGVHVIVIGTGGILRELEGPGENGR